MELKFLEENHVNKTRESKGAIFVTTGIFKIKGFKFQLKVCSRSHDLLIMSMNFRDIVVLNIQSTDYHYIIS